MVFVWADRKLENDMDYFFTEVKRLIPMVRYIMDAYFNHSIHTKRNNEVPLIPLNILTLILERLLIFILAPIQNSLFIFRFITRAKRRVTTSVLYKYL